MVPGAGGRGAVAEHEGAVTSLNRTPGLLLGLLFAALFAAGSVWPCVLWWTIAFGGPSPQSLRGAMFLSATLYACAPSALGAALILLLPVRARGKDKDAKRLSALSALSALALLAPAALASLVAFCRIYF